MNINSPFITCINEVRTQYNSLWWFQKLFISRRLKMAIKNLSADLSPSQLRAFSSTYNYYPLWAPRWLIPGLERYLHRLTHFYITLLSNRTEEDSEIIMHARNPSGMKKIINHLEEQHLWQQIPIKEAIKNNSNPASLANSFFYVSDKKVLISSIGVLANSTHPVTTAQSLNLLSTTHPILHHNIKRNKFKIDCMTVLQNELLEAAKNAGLLTGKHEQTNFDIIIAHPFPQQLKKAIKELLQANYLPDENKQQNFEKLAKKFHCSRLVDALNKVAPIALYSPQEKLDRLLEHEYPEQVAGLLVILNNKGLLNKKNKSKEIWAEIAGIQKLETLTLYYHALNSLNTHYLLNIQNFETVKNIIKINSGNPVVHLLFQLISKLSQLNTQCLKQVEFNQLIKHQKKIFATNKVIMLQDDLAAFIAHNGLKELMAICEGEDNECMAQNLMYKLVVDDLCSHGNESIKRAYDHLRFWDHEKKIPAASEIRAVCQR